MIKRRSIFILVLAVTLGLMGCGGEEPVNGGDEPGPGIDAGSDVGDDPGGGSDVSDGDGSGDDESDSGCVEDCTHEVARGLFMSEELLERARERAELSQEPFATSYSIQSGRANSALDREADPFVMEDMSDITFGWISGGEGTLSEATSKLEADSDRIRTLALEYVLTSEEQFADKALDLMRVWAVEHTPVNIYYFNPDFSSAQIDGQTEGFHSDRPWNFALDAMWQAYGLINISDAYLLLTRNGYMLNGDDDEVIREWILSLTEAVNSSFHAWTRWADEHPNAGSYERYRSDNHLSWSLAGLIAGAAALEDQELAAYVLSGGSWYDREAGEYENPSYIRDVIERAIEGDQEGELGRIYEERIERDPPVGYSFFHLWAIVIVAQVAEVHFDDNLWSYQGAVGGSIEDAFDRYAAFVLGERESPVPEQDGDMEGLSWHFEVAFHQFDKERYRQAVEQLDRHRFIVQSWGPLALLFGE